ncbi:hypothetical protein NN561_010015 [Cricetulus griseus]
MGALGPLPRSPRRARLSPARAPSRPASSPGGDRLASRGRCALLPRGAAGLHPGPRASGWQRAVGSWPASGGDSENAAPAGQERRAAPSRAEPQAAAGPDPAASRGARPPAPTAPLPRPRGPEAPSPLQPATGKPPGECSSSSQP